MDNKVYVLIKCEVITVWEDSGCECCGPEKYEYNGVPEVIGIFESKEELIKELKEINFYGEIEDFLKEKESYEGDYFYYLEETELN